jgi:peptidoglycan/xylan/chitin deacetylase (PgdA/CDA1 family)
MSRFHAVMLSALGGAALWAAIAPGAARGWGLAAVALLASLLVGLGVAIPSWRFFGPIVCRGPADRPRVALTFDDGPDPRSTPPLLDLLRDAGVEAAFFCVGERVEAHPDLAARAAREGHLLANHTYRHAWMTNLLSTSRLAEDIGRAQDALARAAGAAPRYFRPPFGLTNPRVFRALRRLGLRAVGWTVRGLETRGTTADRIADRIRRGLRPGAIVLLHDGGVPADRLVETVRRLVDSIRDAGYTVVRLDRLLDEQ